MHVLAAREALERFLIDLPASPITERLARLASITRALYEASLRDCERQDLAWADHNLAVLISEGLQSGLPPIREVSASLYLGLRRRLTLALEHDPQDLTLALALADGLEVTAGQRDDVRLSEDLALVGQALEHPLASLRLVQAALAATAEALKSRNAQLKEAARQLSRILVSRLPALRAQLPKHPDLAVANIRVHLLAAKDSEGSSREEALVKVRALLLDFERDFGDSRLQRELQAQLLELGGSLSNDQTEEVLTTLSAEAASGRIHFKRALRLIRNLTHGKRPKADLAARLREALKLEGDASESQIPAERELRAFLSPQQDKAEHSLAALEAAFEREPEAKQTAKALFEALTKELRKDQSLVIRATTLDQLLSTVPVGALSHLSTEDIEALIARLREGLGVSRALRFFREKLIQNKELRARESIWKRALSLANELNDEAAALDLSRRLLNEHKQGQAFSDRLLAQAKLAAAKGLIARGEASSEVDDLLRELSTDRSPYAAEATQLKKKLREDPNHRKALLARLIEFERELGINTTKLHTLRVSFTNPSYLLAELTDKPAPDFYEHKYLRVMIRADELPSTLKPTDLHKGDILKGSVRGQDTSLERDKDGLRIYWLQDPKQLELAFDPNEAQAKLKLEDEAYGINSERPLPLRVAWDKTKGRLNARLYNLEQVEFRVRPIIDLQNLPAGFNPEQLGQRGKRMVGQVGLVDGQYRIIGEVELSDWTSLFSEAAQTSAPEKEGA